MRLARRLLALSLNVLLLQLVWTGGRGDCAPVNSRSHDTSSAAMASMHHPASTADGATIAENGTDGHDCSGEMLGADCGQMLGCATTGLVGASQTPSFIAAATDPAIAGDLTRAALAAPQPLPPPPRA